MNELITEKLKQYLIEACGHLKPSSVGHRIRFIKSLFKWTHEEGYILKNPAAKFILIFAVQFGYRDIWKSVKMMNPVYLSQNVTLKDE